MHADAGRTASIAAAACTVAALLWWTGTNFSGLRETVTQSRLPVFAASLRIAPGITAACAAGLALFLAVRGRRIPAALKLADALAWMALGTTWLLLSSLELPLRGALNGNAALELVLDLVFTASLALGSHRFIVFWTIYPRVASPEQIAIDSTRITSNEMKAIRGRIVPAPLARWFDRLEEHEVGPRAVRLRAATWRFLTGRGGAVTIMGAAVALAALNFLAARAASAEAAKTLQMARLPFIMAWAGLVVAAAYMAISTARLNATPRQREQLRWLWAALLLGSALYLVPFLLVCMPIFTAVLIAPDLLEGVAIKPWIDGGMNASAAGLLSVPAFFIVGLALSILYSGSLDPRLAVGRITVWSIVALVLAALFILVERAVVFWLAKTLDLHPSTGALVAGACVAASFQPLRKRAEGWTQGLLARWMPASLLAGGERSEGAVAVVDISGYTALSARSEADARLTSAVLQKCSHEAAARFDGVVVKALGDGVLLRFAVAADAAAAARTIDDAFRAAMHAIGLAGVPLHSGLHWGEFEIASDGDIYGQTVNIASRIADHAAPGELLVSAALAQHLGATGAHLLPVGAQQFKNLPEPIECLRLVAGVSTA